MSQFDKIIALIDSDVVNLSVKEKHVYIQELKRLSKQCKVNAFLAKKYKSDFEVIQHFLDTSIKEKEEKNEQLLDINIKLERFAYTVAHDLKAPIRSIVNFSQLLKRKLSKELDESSAEFLGYIISNSKQMYNLIDDTLDFSKVSHNETKKELVDLNNIISNINELLYSDKENEFCIDFCSLPTVFANKAMMHKLFLNLIQNGLKYNTTPHKSIKITSSENDNYYLFSIQDNGIGMQKEYLDRIFEMYVRINKDPKYEGNGIGLAMCKKIIEIHQGTINVDSTVDVGSVFHFSLKKV